MKFLKFLWKAIGTSDAWIALLIMVNLAQIIRGPTLEGGYWVMFCFLGYFLSRIAEALELIAKKLNN